MIFKIKKIHPKAKTPKYALGGDAGMDLFSVEEFILKPGDIKAIKTGIIVELPPKTVDRGEIGVIVINLFKKDYSVKIGDKIAQLLIQKIERLEIVEVEDLSQTERSGKGFGSTGNK